MLVSNSKPFTWQDILKDFLFIVGSCVFFYQFLLHCLSVVCSMEAYALRQGGEMKHETIRLLGVGVGDIDGVFKGHVACPFTDWSWLFNMLCRF